MTIALATGRTGAGATTRARVMVVAGSAGAAELTEALARWGHEVHEQGAAETISALAEQEHDLLFVEIGLLEAIGLDGSDCSVPVIALGDGTPLPAPAGCIGVVSRAAAAGAAATLVDLVRQCHFFRRRCEELDLFVGGVRDGSALVGRSPVMRRLHGALSRAADSEATVLIEGAPGTGKSLASRMVHCKSRRGNRPMVIQDAAGSDAEEMVEAFAKAVGTSLVIEDVDRLPQPAQQVLVKFLKERPRAGSAECQPPRIIATTSAHLPELVARGAFREDLYYRLHVYPIVIPSLRERTEDIGLLANALLEQCSSQASHRAAGFTPAAMIMLESMSWPGNVAQLESVVRRAHLMAGGAPIDREHVLGPATPAGNVIAPVAMTTAESESDLAEDAIRPFEEEEQRLLSRALRATRGNVRRAAQLLGIGRATLYRKIQQYRLRLQ